MILVTGATGFVGSALVRQLLALGERVKAASRSPAELGDADLRWIKVDDLGPDNCWLDALDGVECVVHCAARVHVMRDAAVDPLAAYRLANVQGVVTLAQQAAQAGVKRLVFLSSIKVNGEWSLPSRPFAADDVPNPQDPYGISKWEAEQALLTISRETGLEVVIVRPPLVYGPGVRANFQAVMTWLRRGIPLPLGAVSHNRRSFVALDNLVSLLALCIRHPAAINQIFLVSDGEDLSTTCLLRRLGQAMDKPARLFPVPSCLLRAGTRLSGRHDLALRLLGSLQVDIRHTCDVLGWNPPVTVDEELRRTVQAFLL